ncbi:MAG: hypothetical protein Q8L48_40590 [Archangium sp.]|nr:hypothetical protein [Archangium sp.]
MTTIRLAGVAHGHGLKERLVLGLLRVLGGRPAPDVVRTLLYRRSFWGDRYNDLLQPVMRGEGAWVVGERELFAAFIANLNRCRF